MHQYKLTFFSFQKQPNLLINTHVLTGTIHILILVIMYLLRPALSSLSDRPQNKKLYCWAGGPRPRDSSSRLHCFALKHKPCRWSGTRRRSDNFRNWLCQRCACSWQWCWCFLVATMWTAMTCASPYSLDSEPLKIMIHGAQNGSHPQVDAKNVCQTSKM